MGTHVAEVEVRGPWSLATSRRFWEGFAPNALPGSGGSGLDAVFLVDTDWSAARATVTQHGSAVRIETSGDGDLESAVEQVQRFLSLDVDGRQWPAVGERDPVIGELQRAMPGLRPCGFYSPYEAAAWTILSRRVTVAQGGVLRRRLIEQLGQDGAFPGPQALRSAELDLPLRKPEYLRAVAEAALDGVLDARRLRAMEPEQAIASVRGIAGVGAFSSELIVLRGANAPDGLPTEEKRLIAEVAERYDGRTVNEVAPAWRPYRTWAAVHLRAAGAAPGSTRRTSG